MVSNRIVNASSEMVYPSRKVQTVCSFTLAVVLGFLFGGCDPSATGAQGGDGPLFVTTIYPFRAILEPVVGRRGCVRHLLAAGASPHTYDPKPSDARSAAHSAVLFYGAPELDEWGARLTADRTIALIDLLPDSMVLDFSDAGPSSLDRHGHRVGRDPHFWMDPPTVRALLPRLADMLCEVEPTACDEYRANADAFSDVLATLQDSVATILAPTAGRSVLLSHPFLQYLLDRNAIVVVGLVEEIPGSEPTARDMQRIIGDARQSSVDAILVLPQLPDRAAQAVSESLQIPIVELDPIGGVEGRQTYEELILYNALVLRQAIIGMDSI